MVYRPTEKTRARKLAQRELLLAAARSLVGHVVHFALGPRRLRSHLCAGAGHGVVARRSHHCVLRGIGKLAPEERGPFGQAVNALKQEGIRDASLQARLEGLEVEREELLRQNEQLHEQLKKI